MRPIGYGGCSHNRNSNDAVTDILLPALPAVPVIGAKLASGLATMTVTITRATTTTTKKQQNCYDYYCYFCD